MKKKLNFFTWFENARAIKAIRNGLVMIIPALMIGSAMLVLMYFPIMQYQTFVNNLFDGNLIRVLNFIYNATFGMMSVLLTLSISYCYARQFDSTRVALTTPIASLICFFIMSGVQSTDTDWSALGVKGMFVAILCGIFATRLQLHLEKMIHRKHAYSDGFELEFNRAIMTIIPTAIVVVVFAIINALFTKIFDVKCFFEFFVNMANALFMPFGRSLFSAYLMVILQGIAWFFGIHGSNVLESVTERLFTPAIQTNMELLANGQAPTEIFTKQFFDVFVLMGGCGSAIALLLAIIIFSKRRGGKRLARLASVPMLFNINELMIFGYPVIFNFTLLIPFVLTPVFCVTSTYLAMKFGLVPYIISDVNWTAPVLISGYIATKSVAGSLLQLFNIIVGVFIYRPFILMYDKQRKAREKAQVDRLVDTLKESERTTVPIALLELSNDIGFMARYLAAELKSAMENGELRLYYQPQFDKNKNCVGAEALLRWCHRDFGMIYPPLVIKLAAESGILMQLEQTVFQMAVRDSGQIRRETEYAGDISVNTTALTIQSEAYFSFIKEQMRENDLKPGEISIEITEQAALSTDDDAKAMLRRIRELGYRLAIDDFSMGHTSLAYLQENQFDTVKLDGSLVQGMVSNPRCRDIIQSITSLSETLGFFVIAEFVEEQEQVDMLSAIGCKQYQGYLFSPAVPLDDFISLLKQK